LVLLEKVERLAQFCSTKHHVFWADAVSLSDQRLFNSSMIRGHRQVTDIYLLGLAKKMGGCLATFDRTIPLSAVTGATRSHLAIVLAT
jgi:predicted nucleic acid-binding protein